MVNRMMHRPSGKTALVRALGEYILLAQFDEFGHPHSHGWYLYQKSEFNEIKEATNVESTGKSARE